jgi:predicted AAA+ superfamily ATPase
MNASDIIELHHLALRKLGDIEEKRGLFDRLLAQSGKHYDGIVGPRGAGKTVILKQLARELPNTIYISLDTLPADDDLFEVIKKLNRDYRYQTFLLDEVYSYPAYDEVLKKMHDFLDIRVVFTSSVALKMKSSAYDLSRRVVLHPLHAFSFREYLALKHAQRLPRLQIQDIFTRAWTPGHLRSGSYFADYLSGGLMPFALQEPEPLVILENILKTIIHKDVSAVARLPAHELAIMEKAVTFIGRSGVDGLNYSSLSDNLKITKYKAAQYVQLLEDAFVLQSIFPKGTNVTREPKILMTPPYRLLYRSREEAAGGLREDFFAFTMRSLAMPVYYLKSTRGAKTPDYLLDAPGLERTVIEIGGKNKGHRRFKDFKAEQKFIFADADTSDGIKRPLFTLGFLH